MATAFSRDDAVAERPLAGIDAVILAGGLGTRLRSVLPDRQKVLANVGGAPFLKKLVDFYAAAGASRIVLALGYRATDVEEFIDHNSGTARVIASIETEPLGTGGALRLALPELQSETVLVANGDSFADVDLAALLHLHRARRSEITLALAFVDDMRRYGRVVVDGRGAVIRFEEKSEAAAAQAGYINAGVYLMQREVIAALPGGRKLSLEHEVFPSRIGNGLHAMEQRIPFIDIGTPESWAAANDFFAAFEKRGVTS